MSHSYALALLLAAVLNRARAVTPVQKVAELLVKLREQVEEEGKAEAVSYDKYACFCKDQADNKVYAIKKSDAKIEEYNAAIDALGGAINELDGAVVTLKGKVGTEQTAATAASEVRGNATQKHLVKRANLTEAVSAITRAIEALRASKGDVAAVKALLAQLGGSAAATPAGSAPVYEYKSGDVLATLQELLITFKAELAKADEDEATAQHDHDMVEGARSMQMKFMGEEIMQKETLSAKKSEEKSEIEKLLTEETKDRDADQAFLDELTEKCKGKAIAWDERSKTRADEVVALSQAIKELEGVDALYATNKKLVGLIAGRQEAASTGQTAVAQRSVRRHHHGRSHRHRRHRGVALRPHHLRAAPELHKRVVLAQTQTTSQQRRPQGLDELRRDMQRRAAELRSPSLAQLVAVMDSSRLTDDHFVKVRELIKDLVAKLEADAVDEATAKSNCDTQMKDGVTERDEKQHDKETLESGISASTAAISALKADIASLSQEIADIHKALNEMTELREADKAANNKTSVEAAEGAAAVRQAIEVLKQFYGTTFLQNTSSPAADRSGNTVGDVAPETFEGEYTGKVQESKGIFGLLEIIASDFDRTASVTAEEEKEAESDYVIQSGDMNEQIGDKEQLKLSKEGDATKEESNLILLQDDLKDATTLHAQAVETLEKLTAACVDTGESWEERTAQREKEIEALKEALSILEAWQS